MDMTAKRWALVAIVVATVLGLVGLGFAAMSTNPPFTVHFVRPFLLDHAWLWKLIWLFFDKGLKIKSAEQNNEAVIKAYQ